MKMRWVIKILNVSLSKKETQVVTTESEFDVASIINVELNNVIQEVINECSKKYFRQIEVEFTTNIK